MTHNITINEKTIDGIWQFVTIDEKDEMISKIDRIIEITVKTKTAEEFQLSEELALLYDVKRLIDVLPFS